MVGVIEGLVSSRLAVAPPGGSTKVYRSSKCKQAPYFSVVPWARANYMYNPELVWEGFPKGV